MKSRPTRRLALALALVASQWTASGVVDASCQNARAVLSVTPRGASHFYTPGQPFAPGADYPRTAGGGTTTYFLNGVFWSFGSGNPIVGLGNDNGRFEGAYPYKGPSWLLPSYHGGFGAFLGGSYGHWQIPGVDGCIDRDGSDRMAPDADECLVVLLTDQGKVGDTYFVVLSTKPDAIGDFQFTPQNGFPSRIELAEVPQPVIVSSSATARKLALEVSVAPKGLGAEQGFHLHCRGKEILAGYKLYARSLPAGAVPPRQFNSQAIRPKWGPKLPAWKPLTPTAVAIGQNARVEIDCEGAADVDLCATLTFGGVAPGAQPYELPNCSASVKLACRPSGKSGGGR